MAAAKTKHLTATEQLSLARKHLDRVQSAWDPPDWSDLTIYGMYSVEAAILAAAVHLGDTIKKTHWDKATYATALATKHGVPDVADLVRKLNSGRKASAYGDEEMPDDLGDPQDLVTEIEEFVDAIDRLIAGAKP